MQQEVLGSRTGPEGGADLARAAAMAACDLADVLVEFTADAFGIRFQPDRGALTIDRIADESAAAQVDGLMVGMVLVSVQGKQVTEVGVEEVFETLKAAGRPLLLGFAKDTRPFPYVFCCQPLRASGLLPQN